jgi:oligopeptide/dipeptide ABC transporter ATP-binding protein
LDAIKGNVPVPLNLSNECGFASRCLEVKSGLCDTDIPPIIEVEPEHFVRCFLHNGKEKM